MIGILHAGCQDVKQFNNLFEAIEDVVSNRAQQQFLIKHYEDGVWEDGTHFLRSFKRMFEPVEGS